MKTPKRTLSIVGLVTLLTTPVHALTYTVTNTNNVGAGSLRQAITDANANAGADIIDFAIPTAIDPMTGNPLPVVIGVPGALPVITGRVDIQGQTQAGFAIGQPKVFLNGAPLGIGFADGLEIAAGGSGSIVQGLAFMRFDDLGAGLYILANDCHVRDCWFGLDRDGTTAQPNHHGIFVQLGTNNTIGPRVWSSGNLSTGITINSADANFIIDCVVGVNHATTTAVPNRIGIQITSGDDNEIGAPGALCQISGNSQEGIRLDRGLRTLIQYCKIGTTRNGLAAIPNQTAISLNDISEENVIGGPTLNEGNIISGNTGDGISIDATSANNRVASNLIGLNNPGNSPIPNGGAGLRIRSANTLVGSALSNQANYICSNAQGIVIEGTGAVANLIYGNSLGVDFLGNASGNGVGLLIQDGALQTQVGTATLLSRNVISGNTTNGVELRRVVDSPQLTTLMNNCIGLNRAATAAIPNGANGIFIDGAPETRIGGNPVHGYSPNYISRNAANGIDINGVSLNTQISNNRIGVGAAGTENFPNGLNGVRLAAHSISVGGTSSSDFNVIGNHSESGIHVVGPVANNIFIARCRIGVNGAGTVPLPNKHGIRIDGGAVAMVLGTVGSPNIISGNTETGIYMDGATLISVENNVIGLASDGLTSLPVTQQTGIAIYGSDHCDIGNPGAGNIISGNETGIFAKGVDSIEFHGNLIGFGGMYAAPVDSINTKDGLWVVESKNCLIGGTVAGEANFIGNNKQSGIVIEGGSSFNNVIARNNIYQNKLLGIDLVDGGGYGAVNPSDFMDTDGGANDGQNAPVITSLSDSGLGSVRIKAAINTIPATDYVLEFFVTDVLNASGHAEGQRYLGSANGITDGVGDLSVEIFVPMTVLGKYITATARVNVALSSSSEFSVGAKAAPGVLSIEPGFVQPIGGGFVLMRVHRTDGIYGTVGASFRLILPNGTVIALPGSVTFGAGDTYAGAYIAVPMIHLPTGTNGVRICLTSPTGGATLGTVDCVPVKKCVVTAVSKPTATSFQLTFESTDHLRYTIRRTSNLASGPWVTITPSPILGMGAPITYTDLGAGLTPRFFYEVVPDAIP